MKRARSMLFTCTHIAKELMYTLKNNKIGEFHVAINE